jgi:2-dehydro-3-deoxyphosphooctonate aldolase (KDO 8-P synthase)
LEKLYKKILNSKIFFILGPCVLDTKDNAMMIAESISKLKEKHPNILFFYKASFDKANRQSVSSYRGLGLDKTKEIMLEIKEKYGLPLLTDIHESSQASKVDFIDIIQIPAFLARQTDLLIEAGKTGKIINIKKSQFMSVSQMKYAAEKVLSTENKKILLTERGTFFAYDDLVVDFRNIKEMEKLNFPVIFDATHSVQTPGSKGNATGGKKEFIKPYALSSLNFGAKGIFMETHPEPIKALCDGANSVSLNKMENIVEEVIKRV